MNHPVNKVVSSTPTVERSIPCVKIGRISWNRVSIPPVNKIMLKAIIPMNWASFALLNWSPNPSLLKSIPTKRKSKRVGMPNRYPVLLIIILMNIKMEPMRSIFSAFIIIVSWIMKYFSKIGKKIFNLLYNCIKNVGWF